MPRKKTLSKADFTQVRRRIEIAKKYADQTFAARDAKWENFYRGKHWSTGNALLWTPSLLDRVTMNYVARLVDLKLAALAAEPPLLRFRPRRTDYESLARIWEVWMPYVWREAECHRHLKEALRDRYIYGRGWVAIDWRLETQEQYFEGERPDDMPENETILFDNPWTPRISPKRMYVDPQVDTLTWEQAEHITWEQKWPLERLQRWAKSDKRVNAAAVNKLKGDDELDPRKFPEEYKKYLQASSFRRATIWRHHEREENRVIYLAKESDEPLLVIDNPYEGEGYPFEPIFGRPVLDEFDAIGEIEDKEAWQELFNLIRSKEASMVRTARHMVPIPDSLSEEDIQKFESDQERVLVPWPSTATFPPREINTTGFPPEMIQMEQALRLDYTELGAPTPLRRGVVQPGLDTATETSLLVSQSSVGERDEQAGWEDFNRRVARKMKARLEQFGDSERVAAIMPENAKGVNSISRDDGTPVVQAVKSDRFVWVRFTPQEIADESEVEVLAGSMGAREEALERAQFHQGIMTVIQIAQFAPYLKALGINPIEVAKEEFRRFGNVETERFFQAPEELPMEMFRPGGGAGQNGQTNLPEMLKSIVQAGAAGKGTVGGGEV